MTNEADVCLSKNFAFPGEVRCECGTKSEQEATGELEGQHPWRAFAAALAWGSYRKSHVDGVSPVGLTRSPSLVSKNNVEILKSVLDLCLVFLV